MHAKAKRSGLHGTLRARIVQQKSGFEKNSGTKCLSPIILSPLNGQVKMSPHEQGDIFIESERVATSGGDFSMYQGRGGRCQKRPAALLVRAASPTAGGNSSRRRGGGAWQTPSRAAQTPPPFP